MNHKKMFVIQAVFLLLIVTAIYFLYPKIDVEVTGNIVKFDSVNADVLILSENPDFSNPRYVEINENLTIPLKPGKYYWKASNGLIEGLKNKIEIKSEVGMKLDIDEDGRRIENIGNVKINVTKTEGGVMVGHIILEPDESEDVGNSGEYVGREEE
jgi:hypothetical protein